MDEFKLTISRFDPLGICGGKLIFESYLGKLYK